MLTIDDVKKAVEGTDFWNYGIRADKDAKYDVGDTANNSHQLYQDPQYDWNDELMYPLIEEGIYKDFYDGGELDGTCAIKFDPNNDASIQNAIKEVLAYGGKYIHVIAGDCAEGGNDIGEIIIRNAEVLGAYDK